tara:strand:- start:413 stop:601 length:189 start_codon:yes stop_codon:yes gene_type:complete
MGQRAKKRSKRGLFGDKIQIWVPCRLEISLQIGVAIKLKPVTALTGLLLTKNAKRPIVIAIK